MAALGRGCCSHAAGLDDHQIWLLTKADGLKTQVLQVLAGLLALVLINFAAQCCYGEGFHRLI